MLFCCQVYRGLQQFGKHGHLLVNFGTAVYAIPKWAKLWYCTVWNIIDTGIFPVPVYRASLEWAHPYRNFLPNVCLPCLLFPFSSFCSLVFSFFFLSLETYCRLSFVSCSLSTLCASIGFVFALGILPDSVMCSKRISLSCLNPSAQWKNHQHALCNTPKCFCCSLAIMHSKNKRPMMRRKIILERLKAANGFKKGGGALRKEGDAF